MVVLRTKKDFIEKTEEAYNSKSRNFIEKAPSLVEAGKLPKEETETLISELKVQLNLCDQKNQAKLLAHNKREEQVDQKQIVTKSLRTYKKVLEEKENVGTEILRDLGLLNEVITEDTIGKCPILKVRIKGGFPYITFRKSPFHGIKLYSRVNTGPFDFETTIFKSNYEDTRKRKDPKGVEVREYYAYYIIDGKKVGRKSQSVRIILDPIE
jgi:hypothetical protein